MTEPDLGPRLERWLISEAPPRAPERVVHETRIRIAATAQRRRWYGLGRPSERAFRFAPLVAAAAIVLVLGGIWMGSRLPQAGGGPGSLQPSSRPTFQCAPAHGLCVGPMQPGSHRSREFVPAFTVTVPAGWTNTLDERGQYDLSYDAGSSYRYPDGTSFHDGVSMFRKPVAESSAADGPETGVGRDARSLADWLAKHADIVASQPVPVSIRGAPGFRVAIGPRIGPRSRPDHCTTDHGLDQCESLFRGGDALSGYGFGIVGPESAVVYLLDLPSGDTVMVVIDDVDGVDASGLIAAATPIVESLVFDR